MRSVKYLILSMLCLSSAFANELKDVDFYQLKLKLDQMSYEQKIERESERIELSGKVDFDFFASDFLGNKNFESNQQGLNLECAKWVYQGPGTREEAVRACRGVTSMDCVNFVYQGSASRQEAAIACRDVKLISCVEWVYQGPGSREEAARACAHVRDMECLEFVYQGPSSRMEAAKICSESDRDSCL